MNTSTPLEKSIPANHTGGAAYEITARGGEKLVTAPFVRRTRGSRVWLCVAVVCGLVHAGFSAAWAFGSDILLDTVGTIAYQIAAMGAPRRMLLLGIIAAGKLVVVAGLVYQYRGLPQSNVLRSRLRVIECIIGGGLLIYGVLSMVGSAIELTMEIATGRPNPASVTALLGHLLIWDLLFALWGMGTVLSTCERAVNRRSAHSVPK